MEQLQSHILLTASSYMGEIFAHFLIYQEALHHMTLQLRHSEFPYM
jgi:hypothetical protein